MNDVLPAEIARWHHVESVFAETLELHGYREIRTPYLESTSLFVGAIGEATDVVSKEMYSFERGRERLTLRPEGTASAARAYVEHGVHKSEPVTRWYYAGPMFRAENTQRGRYRQFHQVGAELFGDPGPGADAEMIDMLVGFLGAIGVKGAEVIVNSLGGEGTRARYREALVAHLTPRSESLSEESKRRLTTNPLRILDSKSPADQAAVVDAPTLLDFLDDADRAHFDDVRRLLDTLGTPYRVDPRLVRGLDYYTRTLFEIKAAPEILGAGSTVVGGGRYDHMIEGLGGPSVPAIGFAAGLERLLLASEDSVNARRVDAFVVPMDAEGVGPALVLARELRGRGLACEVETRQASMKNKLKRADGIEAKFALILGSRELADNQVMVKNLAEHAQEHVARDAVAAYLTGKLSGLAAAKATT